MNESLDRMVADWLHEGPDRGPREGLERALAATRRAGQRPRWTLPERWLPMQLTMTRTPVQRPVLLILLLALLIAALTATAVWVGSRPRQVPPPFRNGAIVYAEYGTLFIADQPNGAPRPLTTGLDRSSGPAFSPLGDRIAFVDDAAGGSRVLTIRPDGSAVTELATVRGSLGVRLGWSPDGTNILAVRDGSYGANPEEPDTGPGFNFGSGSWQLHVIASDGSRSRMVDAGPGTRAGPAAWRPDGRHIAFVGSQEAGRAVFIADADGSNVRRLPIGYLVESDGLEWSPDGTHLSLTSRDAIHVGQVIVADIDANGGLATWRRLPLDLETSAESTPVWSPDGSLLAFMVHKGSGLQVGVVRVDGSGYRTVSLRETPAFAQAASWSPDGRSLVIHGQGSRQDPDTGFYRTADKAWLVDLTTGEQTAVQTPIQSWQRLAP